MAKSVCRGSKQFIVLFERRIKDNFIQNCFADIEASTRCRTYKDIKSIHDIEPYLRRDIHSSLRSASTKLRLSVISLFNNYSRSRYVIVYLYLYLYI